MWSHSQSDLRSGRYAPLAMYVKKGGGGGGKKEERKSRK